MCGIAGFCSFDRDFLQNSRKWTQVLVDMRTAIAHRGHDQTGEYLRKHVGLAHTRLSIRDLAGGAQPMLRRQDGVEYAIVYNGEIYNAEELKQDLEGRGFVRKSSPSACVIGRNDWIVGKINHIGGLQNG